MSGYISAILLLTTSCWVRVCVAVIRRGATVSYPSGKLETILQWDHTSWHSDQRLLSCRRTHLCLPWKLDAFKADIDHLNIYQRDKDYLKGLKICLIKIYLTCTGGGRVYDLFCSHPTGGVRDVLALLLGSCYVVHLYIQSVIRTNINLTTHHASHSHMSCESWCEPNLFVQIFSLSYLPGIHGDLRRRDAFQAGGYGSVLLLPGGLELFWRFHCDTEFSRVGSGGRRRLVCVAVIPIGNSFYLLTKTKMEKACVINILAIRIRTFYSLLCSLYVHPDNIPVCLYSYFTKS